MQPWMLYELTWGLTAVRSLPSCRWRRTKGISTDARSQPFQTRVRRDILGQARNYNPPGGEELGDAEGAIHGHLRGSKDGSL
jgi:hypothetical protein